MLPVVTTITYPSVTASPSGEYDDGGDGSDGGDVSDGGDGSNGGDGSDGGGGSDGGDGSDGGGGSDGGDGNHGGDASGSGLKRPKHYFLGFMLTLYLSFVCNVSIFFSEEHFPFGVQQIFLYQKRDVKVFIVPPGNFFSPTRKLNIVDLNTGYKYIYTLGYTVSKGSLPIEKVPYFREFPRKGGGESKEGHFPNFF